MGLKLGVSLLDVFPRPHPHGTCAISFWWGHRPTLQGSLVPWATCVHKLQDL